MAKDKKAVSEKSNKNKSIVQAIKFTIFSLSAGLIQVLSFTALQELPPLLGMKEFSYLMCHIPSLALSVIWNITLNRKLTFQSASNVPIAMLKVAVFYLIFTPVSGWLGDIADTAGWNHYLIEALVMASNFILEFLYQKFFVFREPKNKKEKHTS